MLKILVATILSLFTLCAVGTLSAGTYVATGGFANVSVENEEVDLSFWVPVRLVDLAIDLARFVGASAGPHGAPWRTELDAELGSELPGELSMDDVRATLRRLSNGLAELPDGEFVEVRTPREHVTVEMQRGRLRVDVVTTDTEVHVGVPRRAAERLTRKIARLAEESI